MLAMEIEISLCDRLGRKPAVWQATAIIVGRCSADLAVDDDVRNVNAAWPELPRHALRNRAQGKLWRCEVGEIGAAPQ